MSEAGCREEQPRAPVSLPCVSAMPCCQMENALMDTPDQSPHLHRMPAESPPDMLRRHPCFPSETAPGMTARQPNSASLTAVPVAAMRTNSSCMGRLLSSGGDPMLRAPALPVPATKGMCFWRSRERVPGPVPLTGAASSLFFLGQLALSLSQRSPTAPTHS